MYSERIKCLVEISKIVTSSTNFFEIKDEIIDKMLKLVHPTKSCVNLFYENSYEYAYLVCSRTLEYISEAFPMENTKGVQVDFDIYPDYIHESTKEKKVIYVENVFEDERAKKERDLALQEGYVGRIVFPFVINDKTVGFMTCFLDNNDSVDESDIDFISSVASLLTLSIEITMKSNDTKLLISKLRDSINRINKATQNLYANNDIKSFLDNISEQACKVTKSSESMVVINGSKNTMFSFYNPNNEKSNFKMILDKIVEEKHIGNFCNNCNQYEEYGVDKYIYYNLQNDGETIGYIACVNSKNYSNDDLNILSVLAKQVTVAFQLYDYNEREMKHKMLKNELDVLSKQQKFIMDKTKDINVGSKKIDFYHKAARVVGGDFYHSLQIDDDNVSTIITDVMGHGMISNYFVSMMKGAFKTLAHEQSNASDIMSKLNSVLYDEFDEGGAFATSIITTINTKDNVMKICNAGHHKPIGIYKDKGCIVIEEMKINKGVPIGVIKDFSYGEEKYDISNYKMVCMYTDGIIEIKNKEKEEYGIERFKKFLENNYDLEKESFQRKLKNELEDFSGKQTYEDDILLVILKD